MGVPSGIYKPGSYLEINNSRAINPFGTEPFRICVFGEHAEMTTSETIEYKRILSTTDAYSKYVLGTSGIVTSISYESLRSVFDNLPIGSDVEVYCVSQPQPEDNTATITPPTTTITLPATLKAGTLEVFLSGVRYTVSIVSTDTIASIGNKLENLTVDGLPVSAGFYNLGTGVQVDLLPSAWYVSSTIGDITANIRSYDGGPLFDGILRADLTTSVTTTSNDVDLDDYIGVLPDKKIDLFVNPYKDSTNYGKLQTEIVRRFGSTVQLEGHQIFTQVGTASALVTLMGSGGEDYNDQHLTVLDGGYVRPCPHYVQSASVAGLMAGSLSEDPAVPMMNLDMVGVYPEIESNERTFEEQNALIAAGMAALQVDTNGNVETLRITTTYINTDGLADASYRDANTVFTASYLRQSLLRLMAITYVNYKLADDGIRVGAGQKVATPRGIKATILGWFTEMERRAIVENYTQFKTQLIVTRDDDDKTRVNAIIPPDVVNQFRIFAGEIQFIL